MLPRRRNPGAPSQDFLLSAPEVASKVTGNMPEQVTSLLPLEDSCRQMEVPHQTRTSRCVVMDAADVWPDCDVCNRTQQETSLYVGIAAVCAQIHMTQGATPSSMYISWVTGNASYTYCSQDDNATCGDTTNACYCNESPAAFTSSQVKYSTDGGLENAMIGQEAGDYPVTVRRRPPLSTDVCAPAPRRPCSECFSFISFMHGLNPSKSRPGANC